MNKLKRFMLMILGFSIIFLASCTAKGSTPNATISGIVYTLGEDIITVKRGASADSAGFLETISTSDVVLDQRISTKKCTNVEWVSTDEIKLTISGNSYDRYCEPYSNMDPNAANGTIRIKGTATDTGNDMWGYVTTRLPYELSDVVSLSDSSLIKFSCKITLVKELVSLTDVLSASSDIDMDVNVIDSKTITVEFLTEIEKAPRELYINASSNIYNENIIIKIVKYL